MIIQLNKYQIKLTTNLLTNNHINIKIINNNPTLIIELPVINFLRLKFFRFKEIP